LIFFISQHSSNRFKVFGRTWETSLSWFGEKLQNCSQNFAEHSPNSSHVSLQCVFSKIYWFFNKNKRCENKLIVVIGENYPFFRRHVFQIKDFVRNVIRMMDYVPCMRVELFRIVVSETLRLDVREKDIFSDDVSNIEYIILELYLRQYTLK